MGSSFSKEEADKDKQNMFSRSFSLAIGSAVLERPDRFSWNSRLLSMPKPSRKDDSFISLLNTSLESKVIQQEDCKVVSTDSDEIVEDTNPAMLSLTSDYSGSFSQPRSLSGSFNQPRSFRRSVSIQSSWSSVSVQAIGELESGCRIFNSAALSDFPSAFNTSNHLFCTCASDEFVTERNLGLRSLLKPSLRSSRSFASPARNATDFKLKSVPKRSMSLKTYDDHHCVDDSGFDKSFDRQSATVTQFMNASENLTQNPMFDETILASFEKALEITLSDDNWNSSDLNTPENITSSSETSSEAGSPKLEKSTDAGLGGFSSIERTDGKVFEESSNHMMNAFLSRKFPLSRLFSFENNKSDWTGEDYLHIFERRCPPKCENKVVLYFTSLRGIRKTFEDCCTLRLILKGFGVSVDERDVWMHSQYRQELTAVLGAALPVPRLFILGRYIGGAEEVEQLNEEGILVKMLDGLSTDQRQACDACGDVRFIPCITCNGSCKIFSEGNKLERCQECNENGLIMCPWCDGS